MAKLAIRDFHVFRGERHVLRGVEFDLEAGICLQVTGRNGAGKTTLLRALCGIVDVEQGEVLWDGKPIDRRSPEFHSQMAYLGHDAPLKGDLSGRENLRFSVGLRRTALPKDFDAALERVGARGFAERPVRSLSAGQRRRIALAALWLYGVPLWILDEPTTNLDVQGQQLVTGMIEEQLVGGGMVVAAVHHELQLAAGLRAELVIGGQA
jgi:heme exporter protein A